MLFKGITSLQGSRVVVAIECHDSRATGASLTLTHVTYLGRQLYHRGGHGVNRLQTPVEGP